MSADPARGNRFDGRVISDPPGGAPMGGRHVYLRTVAPSDYPLLQRAEQGPDLGFRWRYRGTTPSPEQWVQGLWSGVLAQYLVVDRRGDRPVGLVFVHGPNFQDGYAHLAAARLSPGRSPAMIFGTGLFLEYVFTMWNFRKLYLDTLEFNYRAFASGLGSLFEIEARLREHCYFDGKYWDQLTLAIYRNTWELDGERLLAIEAGKPRQGSSQHQVRTPARADAR
jgi:hypothetical protein